MSRQDHYHLGSGANIFTALVSHIPCCGPQVFAGVWGLKLLSAYAVTALYQWQFIIPVIISFVTTCWFVWRMQGHGHHQLTQGEIVRFFVADLMIGYAIVLVLYLFLPPPGDHYLLQTGGRGYISRADHVAGLVATDEKRMWPWNTRYFIAHLDARVDSDEAETVFPAKELPWYQAMTVGSEKYFFTTAQTHPAVLRLYARPNSIWFGSSAEPEKFFMVVPNGELQ